MSYRLHNQDKIVNISFDSNLSTAVSISFLIRFLWHTDEAKRKNISFQRSTGSPSPVEQFCPTLEETLKLVGISVDFSAKQLRFSSIILHLRYLKPDKHQPGTTETISNHIRDIASNFNA